MDYIHGVLYYRPLHRATVLLDWGPTLVMSNNICSNSMHNFSDLNNAYICVRNTKYDLDNVECRGKINIDNRRGIYF